eukprot:6206961-Pleurochrysis_carterae.AAC.2
MHDPIISQAEKRQPYDRRLSAHVSLRPLTSRQHDSTRWCGSEAAYGRASRARTAALLWRRVSAAAVVPRFSVELLFVMCLPQAPPFLFALPAEPDVLSCVLLDASLRTELPVSDLGLETLHC